MEPRRRRDVRPVIRELSQSPCIVTNLIRGWVSSRRRGSIFPRFQDELSERHALALRAYGNLFALLNAHSTANNPTTTPNVHQLSHNPFSTVTLSERLRSFGNAASSAAGSPNTAPPEALANS